MTAGDGRLSELITARRLLASVTVVAFLVLATLSINMSMPRADYNASDSIKWEEADHDPHPQLTDTDGDLIPDVEEYYPGDHVDRQDMDGDGMLDFWEARWSVLDPVTGERNLYGLDPTDMWEDPDGDGYDFDGNGRVDWYDDRIVSHYSKLPPSEGYLRSSVADVLSSPAEYDGRLILLEGVYVYDNGSYREGDGYDHGSEISIQVSDERKGANLSSLTVVLRPFSIRPSRLMGSYEYSVGRYMCGQWVDVQGMFVLADDEVFIEVRGVELFTNLHEFNSRFYTGDGTTHPIVRELNEMYNETDPMDPDTDDDGMTDGWEARYGAGYRDADNGTYVWVWHIDPTDPGDASEDPDGDGWNNREEFAGGTSPVDGADHP